MAERRLSAQVVREGEEVVISFASAGWKDSELRVTTLNGILKVEALQDGIRIGTELLNLRRNP